MGGAASPRSEQQAAALTWADASLRAQDILGIPKDQQSILPDQMASRSPRNFPASSQAGRTPRS